MDERSSYHCRSYSFTGVEKERKKGQIDGQKERERGWRGKNMIDRETEVHTAWNDENKFGKRSISLEVAGNSYRRGFAFS